MLPLDHLFRDGYVSTKNLGGSSVLSSLIERLPALSENQRRIAVAFFGLEDPEGRKFEPANFVPGEPTLTVGEIERSLIALIALLGGVDEIEDSSLIPGVAIARSSERLDELISVTGELARVVEEVQSQGVQQIEPNSIILIRKDGQRQKLAGYFRQIWERVGQVTEQLLPILFFGRLTSLELSVIVTRVQGQLHTIETIAAGIARLADEVRARSSSANDRAAEAATDRAEIERLKLAAEADRKTLSEHAAEASAKLASINTDAERASTLRATVDGHQAQFEAFQRSLNDREASFKSRDAEQTALVDRMSNNEQETERLLKAAEAMLSSATVAGLASAYGKTREDLSSELVSARKAFYAGVILMVASVIPAAIYAIPFLAGLLSVPQPQLPTDPWLFALQLVARLALLIPAAWYLRFAANRHAALFRLREEYSHRYALASSVEGFKKQAENYNNLRRILQVHLMERLSPTRAILLTLL